jgi:hypothetical protein
MAKVPDPGGKQVSVNPIRIEVRKGAGKRGGCFYCFAIYSPDMIDEGWDGKGIDSVLPES